MSLGVPETPFDLVPYKTPSTVVHRRGSHMLEEAATSYK